MTHRVPREGTFKISNKEDFKLQRGDLALIKAGLSAGLSSHILLFIPRRWPVAKPVGFIEVAAHG